MPAPQLLYGCRDSGEMGSMSYRANPSSSLTSGVALNIAGMTLPIGAGGSESWFTSAANWYAILSGGGRAIIGRVVELNTTAHTVFFLPINDFETYDFSGFTFPSGSTLTAVGFIPLELPIDLSEAEPGLYKYLILVAGNAGSFGGQAPVEMYTRINGRPGNPFHAEHLYYAYAHQSLFHTRAMNYFSARTLQVSGGDTRIATLQMSLNIAPFNYNAGICNNARIAAIRVDNCPVFVEASGTGATNTVGSGTPTLIADIVLPEAGDYMVVASAQEGSDNLGAATHLDVDVAATSTSASLIFVQQQYDTSQVVGDRRSFGCARMITNRAAGEHVRLRCYTGFPGNIVRVDDWYFCVFKLPPGVMGRTTALATTGTSVSGTPVEVANGTLSLPAAGRYLEFVHAIVNNVSGGTDRRVFARPRWPTEAASIYYIGTQSTRGRVYKHPQNGTFVAGCFFHRTRRGSGSNKVYLDAYDESGETGAISASASAWTALYFPDMPKPGADQIVTAKVETAHWYRRWAAYVYPNSFQHSLPIGSRVSRVIRGGTDMVRVGGPLSLDPTGAVDSTGRPISGYFNHDENLGQVRIRLPSGVAPSDPSEVILVCLWIFAATDQVSLIESQAAAPVEAAGPQPYHARLIHEPSYSQEVRADGTGATSSSTIGQIDLAGADGYFDPDVRRRRIDGLRTIIRRGPRSDLREMVHTVQLLATNGGHVLDNELSIKLYSSLIELRKPLTEATMQVIQGGILQDAITVPVCFGVLGRVPAYLVTWTPGAGNPSTYRITSAALGLEAIDTVLYLDPSRVQPPTTPIVFTSNPGTGALAGTLTVTNNNSFALNGGDANNPPDVVYVKVWGSRAIPGTPTSRVLRYPGEIAWTMLTAAALGKMPLDRVDHQSFIDLDRIWRKRITSGAPVQIPVPVGAYFDQTIEIGEAVSQVLGQIFALRGELPAGRLNATVMDFGANQLATNPGFESSGTNIWPWFAQGNGTQVVTTNPAYEGTRAVEISSGTNPQTGVYQHVNVRKPGFTVAGTPLAALRSGLDKYVRIGIQRPSDGFNPTVSEPFLIASTAWKRLVFWLPLDEDEVGPTLVYIFPAYGVAGANTAILVDNFEVWPVALVSRNRKTQTYSEEDEEAYYQARVEVSTNPLADINPAVVLTDGDLAGLGAGLSLAKFASPGSGRADFGSETRIVNADGAAGVAAALLRYFASPRHTLKTTEIVGWRRPAVNDILLDDSQFRKVSASDENPIYSIRRVAVGKSFRTVEVTAETRSSLISDTLEINPQTVPLGMILPSVDGTCPTDWQPYTAPNNYYLTGATASDLVPGNTIGQWRHAHALNHDHVVQAHTHVVTGATLGNLNPPYGAPTELHYIPQVTTAHANHVHSPVAGGPWNTGGIKAGGERSTQPNVPLVSRGSGNLVSCLRVMLCKRTAATVDPIPMNLAFFSQSAASPGGYARASEFDGKVLRVAYAVGAVSTTTSGTHTPGVSSSTFVVASATNIVVGRTLQIGTTPHYTGVVTAVAGTTITVDVFNMAGDTVGVPYTNVGVSAPAMTAGVSETWPDHDHGAVVDSHQHNETHAHDPGPVDGAVSGIAAGTTPTGQFGDFLTYPSHDHSIKIEIPTATTQVATAAGGTIAAMSQSPESVALAFHKANSVATKQVGAGLGGFTDGAICPPGWVEYAAARRRILKGSAAGAGEMIMMGGHQHSATYAQHTSNHNHGGSVTGGITTYNPFAVGLGDPGDAAIGPGTWRDHGHDFVLSGIAAHATTLQALTIGTAVTSGDALLPPAYALRFCVKA